MQGDKNLLKETQSFQGVAPIVLVCKSKYCQIRNVTEIAFHQKNYRSVSLECRFCKGLGTFQIGMEVIISVLI